VGRRFAVLVASAACLAGLVPAQAEAQLSTVSFRTPSRNIGCVFRRAAHNQPAFLRCDVLSGLKPAPRRGCQLDWVGLGLTPRGRANPICAGDTAVDSRSRILAYGRTWRRGPFRCISRRTGLSCTNQARRGFVLSRSTWRRIRV
jgi:hypothetical protein